MIVRRQPPFPLTFTIDDLTIGETYRVEVEDDSQVVMEDEFVADDTSHEVTLPAKLSLYDETYSVNVYWGDIMIDVVPLSIYRPYVRKADIPAGTDEEAYYEAEARARYVIDAGTGGFYNTIKFYETQGVGGDYLPIPYKVNKLLRVWEDGEKVFDVDSPEDNVYSYELTKDRTSIAVSDDTDRLEASPIKVPSANSDSFGYASGNGGYFRQSSDYVVEVATGWLVVPADIVEATKILVKDMETGSKYLDRYIIEYDTDQYRVKYRAAAFDGTGNRVVDKILSKYQQDYIYAGVL